MTKLVCTTDPNNTVAQLFLSPSAIGAQVNLQEKVQKACSQALLACAMHCLEKHRVFCRHWIINVWMDASSRKSRDASSREPMDAS